MSGSVYVRKASGVVREAGWLDVAMFNAGGASIGIAATWALTLVPSFYYGANMLTALILGTSTSIPLFFVYYFFVTTMPRSGGDYVYLSRSFGPMWGFIVSFGMAMGMLFYVGQSASFVGSMGMSVVFDVMGRVFNNPGWLDLALWSATPVGMFVIGAITIGFFTLVLHFSTRLFYKIQNFTMVWAHLSLLIIFILMLSTTPQAFAQAWNSKAAFWGVTQTYENIIAQAKATGWLGMSQGFSLWHTWVARTWLVGWSLNYAYMSVNMGGEIKDVQRNSLIGMIGYACLTWVMLALVAFLPTARIGYDFIGALGWNFYVNPGYSLPIIPYIGLITNIITNNQWIWIFNAIGYLFWVYIWVPQVGLYCIRLIWAWGIDRILPDWVAKVHPKYHTTWVANLIGMFIGFVYLYLYSFTNVFQLWTGGIPLGFTPIFMALAAVIFPFRNKGIFDKSPTSYKWKIANSVVPVVTIAGLWWLILGIFGWITGGLDPFFSSWYPPQGFIVAMGYYVFAVVWYQLIKRYRRNQGVNLDLLFSEIPIE